MKNKIVVILALGCMLAFISCNSGLTNDQAKETFLKDNSGQGKKTVNTILIKEISKNSYIARINYTWGQYTFEEEYIFSKWDTGWTCSRSELPKDPERWK